MDWCCVYCFLICIVIRCIAYVGPIFCFSCSTYISFDAVSGATAFFVSDANARQMEARVPMTFDFVPSRLTVYQHHLWPLHNWFGSLSRSEMLAPRGGVYIIIQLQKRDDTLFKRRETTFDANLKCTGSLRIFLSSQNEFHLPSNLLNSPSFTS